MDKLSEAKDAKLDVEKPGNQAYEKLIENVEKIPSKFAEECSKAPPEEFTVIDMMKTNIAGNKQHWDGRYNPEKFWEAFGYVYPEGFFNPNEAKEKKAGSSLDLNVEVLIGRLQVIKPKKILEVGCGFGRILPFVATYLESVEKVVGVDFSPTMIKQVPHYLAGMNEEKSRKIEVIVADARDLPFPDNHFDTTYTHVCLTHMPPEFIPKVTSEIARVTKNWIVHIERFNYMYEHPNQHRWSHMLVPYYLDLGWEVHEYDKAHEEHCTKVLTLRK